MAQRDPRPEASKPARARGRVGGKPIERGTQRLVVGEGVWLQRSKPAQSPWSR
jgi:hypothetical protein